MVGSPLKNIALQRFLKKNTLFLLITFYPFSFNYSKYFTGKEKGNFLTEGLRDQFRLKTIPSEIIENIPHIREVIENIPHIREAIENIPHLRSVMLLQVVKTEYITEISLNMFHCPNVIYYGPGIPCSIFP